MVSTRRKGYQTPDRPPRNTSKSVSKVKNKVGSPAAASRKSAAPSPLREDSKSVSKVKNKVGSPAAASRKSAAPSPLREEEYSSDEFDLDKEEDILEPPPAVAPSPSDSSLQSQSSRRSKLPGHLQIQLVTDIQAKGGIDKFGLGEKQAIAALCDARPEIYGNRGDPIRSKIGKKVCKWREKYNKSQAAWFQFVSDLKITEKPSKNAAAATKPKTAATNPKPTATKPKAKSVKTQPSFPSFPASVSIPSIPSQRPTNTMSDAEDDPRNRSAYFRNIDPDLSPFDTSKVGTFCVLCDMQDLDHYSLFSFLQYPLKWISTTQKKIASSPFGQLTIIKRL